MGKATGILASALLSVIASTALASTPAPAEKAIVRVNWQHVTRVSNTVPTTQILAHKFTLRTSPLHDPEFRALKNLDTNDTRLQFWFSVTRQAVAELKPPTAARTFWDFQYMDPLVADYYANTKGKHHINIGTIPRWMFKVPPEQVPTDPGASFYQYTDGTSGDLLKDPSGRQFAEYQVRLYEWYTKGGFTDELGHYHHSGHHYKIDYWDVLNEPDFENKIDVQQYTRIYDAVTTAIHKIDPNVQFFGPEVSGAELEWARYFLDPKNHAPGALPVEWFTVHNYVNSNNDPSSWHADFFTNPPASATDGAAAKPFVGRLKAVMKIRDELSPKTKVIVDEMGVFDLVRPGDDSCRSTATYTTYNPLYWNANGANWAYNFIAGENLGLRLVSMSQMDGYPTQCPSISMFDYDTAKPNAHYWALKLVNSNFGPGDKLVLTNSSSDDVAAQAAITHSGRKLLLVNTTDHAIEVDLAGAYRTSGLRLQVVDEKSGEQPPRIDQVSGTQVLIAPFAVVVVSQRVK